MRGWDDPETATYYEAFCQRHSRYARANAALVAHAELAPDMRLLDLGAGTGRTTQAALRRLGERGRVVCVEPASGMRIAGMRRITDPRVQWSDSLPDAPASFDRILCGAAIWQMEPLSKTIQTLASRLSPGGLLCFNIPAAYVMEPDEPGGGSDALLLSLPALLAELSDAPAIVETSSSTSHDRATPPRQAGAAVMPSPDAIRECLNAAGLRAASWSFRVRMSQDAYADWLKIPVLTDRLLGPLTPGERARAIDSALSSVDRTSWKWERWRGWTAWKS